MTLNNKKIMGIVGIRSGSKGVPNKNIQPLFGKPLVGWILDVAKNSKYINRLVVSTDSQEYADVATSFGAEVPCLRPPEFATDFSPEFEYVKHMIEWLETNEAYKPDIVVRLMSTVPSQTSEDIDAVIKILIEDEKADSAVVISEARQHPMKALKIIDDGEGGEGLVTYFSDSSHEVTPIARQNYEQAYYRSNVIAFNSNVLFNTNSLTGDVVRFHKIPQDRAIDIDNEIDFQLAELILRNYEQ